MFNHIYQSTRSNDTSFITLVKVFIVKLKIALDRLTIIGEDSKYHLIYNDYSYDFIDDYFIIL